MAKQTRQDILISALRHFADRGFYGASIAEIAGDLGVTKQALLHHFGTKEKLYGEVLQGISQEFMTPVDGARDMQGDPADVVEHALLAIYDKARTAPLETQLLMRELLDNKRRLTTAQTWYMRPFLDGLIAMLKRTSGWGRASDAATLAAICQILGAIKYVSFLEDSLPQMYDADMARQTEIAYPDRLRQMIRQMIATPPGGGG